jgi:hypothetical protein
MKVVHVSTYKEFQDAGLKPYRSSQHPWNYCLHNEEGLFGFSLNKVAPTTWLGPCEDPQCHDGWHTRECITEFRRKMSEN